jgi:anti-sigma factor ChrR (cupin superfamily)
MRSFLAEHDTEQLVTLYAAGALAPDEVTEFERRCAAGWPEAQEMLDALTTPIAELAADIPPVAPPPELRAAILKSVAPKPPHGYTILGSDDSAFHPLPYPGISMRLLNVDRDRQTFSCLMRFAPGARLPAHPHAEAEECIVLEGTLMVGDVRMRAGDYQRVEAGVNHVEQWSDTGGLAFITAPLELLHHD